MKPSEIERQSMSIIRQELRERGIQLPAGTERVTERVIHATADFDFAGNLDFTPDAVDRGVEALRSGLPVVTDTNMILSGISKPALSRLGAEAHCLMADPAVAASARVRGITRATVAAEHACAQYPGCIYAVGNAPTALFTLAEQVERGFRPALIVAVPVGFVNVVEAKELIWESAIRHDFPCIVAHGRKGGSTVAVAILNALLYTAAGLLDPESR